jgi:hypothetical protein
MSTTASGLGADAIQPVQLHVEAAIDNRNRLTTAFRIILAIPHLLLVGGPIAGGMMWTSGDANSRLDWGAGGVLGAVAAIVALIAWFAILFTGRYPEGLWNLAAFYLRWRVRAIAYSALLRDEYPPFGDGEYPARVMLQQPSEPRDRLTVAFRLILAIPQILAVWVLGVAWLVTSIIAWFSILLTGRYPARLYEFGVGVLRWNVRLEAYLLLLHDQYPPFSMN